MPAPSTWCINHVQARKLDCDKPATSLAPIDRS